MLQPSRTLSDLLPFKSPGAVARGFGRFCAAGALTIGLLGIASDAGAACRQALVFALDVSSSVGDPDYRQQLDGLATALQDPEVSAAIVGDPDYPLAVAAFEWSGKDYAGLIVDWTLIVSIEDIDIIARQLRAWQRRPAPRETAIGAALETAAALFTRAPDCWEKTIDLSTDGRNNDGPSPRDVHGSGVLADVTVNALYMGPISSGGNDPEVESVTQYLRENVIGGPGAFVATAYGIADFTAAMRRKLILEIARARALPLPGGSAAIGHPG